MELTGATEEEANEIFQNNLDATMHEFHTADLSEELEEIIDRCTREEPEARYQVAGEVMRDLSRKGCRRSGGRRAGGRRRDFVRHVEKQICLTDFYRL